MSREEFDQQSQGLARVFLDAALAQGLPHALLLQGLLLAYQSIAVAHPCCTAKAGRELLHVGGYLIHRASAQTAPSLIH